MVTATILPMPYHVGKFKKDKRDMLAVYNDLTVTSDYKTTLSLFDELQHFVFNSKTIFSEEEVKQDKLYFLTLRYKFIERELRFSKIESEHENRSNLYQLLKKISGNLEKPVISLFNDNILPLNSHLLHVAGSTSYIGPDKSHNHPVHPNKSLAYPSAK